MLSAFNLPYSPHSHPQISTDDDINAAEASKAVGKHFLVYPDLHAQAPILDYYNTDILGRPDFLPKGALPALFARVADATNIPIFRGLPCAMWTNPASLATFWIYGDVTPEFYPPITRGCTKAACNADTRPLRWKKTGGRTCALRKGIAGPGEDIWTQIGVGYCNIDKTHMLKKFTCRITSHLKGGAKGSPIVPWHHVQVKIDAGEYAVGANMLLGSGPMSAAEGASGAGSSSGGSDCGGGDMMGYHRGKDGGDEGKYYGDDDDHNVATRMGSSKRFRLTSLAASSYSCAGPGFLSTSGGNAYGITAPPSSMSARFISSSNLSGNTAATAAATMIGGGATTSGSGTASHKLPHSRSVKSSARNKALVTATSMISDREEGSEAISDFVGILCAARILGEREEKVGIEGVGGGPLSLMSTMASASSSFFRSAPIDRRIQH